jgi:hypothetical protein
MDGPKNRTHHRIGFPKRSTLLLASAGSVLGATSAALAVTVGASGQSTTSASAVVPSSTRPPSPRGMPTGVSTTPTIVTATTVTPPVPAGQPSAIAPSVSALANMQMSVAAHQPAPSVSIPATACTNSDLSAAVTGPGPTPGMNKILLIVSLISSTPCVVNGLPTLQYTGATNDSIDVQDAVDADADPASNVAVGPGVTASFLLQLPNSTCPTAEGLLFGLPGTSATVPISPGTGNSWQACSTIGVSPFEQGNTASRYQF